MFNSIRGSMLLWQGAIVAAAVLGFGIALYRQVEHASREEVDAELLGLAQSIATTLPDGIAPGEVKIPAAYSTRFGKAQEDAPYVAIFDAEGNLAAASPGSGAVPPPKRRHSGDRRPHKFRGRTRSIAREMTVETERGMYVLVGRNTHREQLALARLMTWTLFAGSGVVALGICGGWLISKRVLAPIDRMSAAAEQISETNFAQRLDVASSQSELGRLASVLNRTFDRLQAAFQRQAQFTADASHELRTPVSIILSQSEQALAKERTGEEYRQALAACERAARRMKLLVESLMSLARADSGSVASPRQPIDVAEVVRSAAALVEPLAQQQEVEMHLQLQPAVTLGNPDQLTQVVTNLLTNAVQYNHPAGEVFVTVGKDETSAVLSVRDTGEGIAAEHQPRIFERFYRVDMARSSVRGGSGLGLAICRQIVEGHGGTIDVVSEPGHGSVFTVRMPLVKTG